MKLCRLKYGIKNISGQQPNTGDVLCSGNRLIELSQVYKDIEVYGCIRSVRSCSI